MTPAFANKHDEDVEHQVESITQFIMTKNIHDECLKTRKDRKSAKQEEKKRKEERVEAMNRFETEQGI